jgi:hypothetical protein
VDGDGDAKPLSPGVAVTDQDAITQVRATCALVRLEANARLSNFDLGREDEVFLDVSSHSRGEGSPIFLARGWVTGDPRGVSDRDAGDARPSPSDVGQGGDEARDTGPSHGGRGVRLPSNYVGGLYQAVPSVPLVTAENYRIPVS